MTLSLPSVSPARATRSSESANPQPLRTHYGTHVPPKILVFTQPPDHTSPNGRHIDADGVATGAQRQVFLSVDHLLVLLHRSAHCGQAISYKIKKNYLPTSASTAPFRLRWRRTPCSTPRTLAWKRKRLVLSSLNSTTPDNCRSTQHSRPPLRTPRTPQAPTGHSRRHHSRSAHKAKAKKAMAYWYT